MAPLRPSLSITMPPNPNASPYNFAKMPKTPDQMHDEPPSAIEPPSAPRAQPFKVRRRRATIPREELDIFPESGIIPTIEMTEVPAQATSPTIHSPRSAHLLSPMTMHNSFTRGVTPPKTPAPRQHHPIFSQLESPVEEWDLINNTTRPFARSGSICSSFSDSSLSSCGSSAFSLPTGTCDSPRSEATDPFLDDDMLKHDKSTVTPTQSGDLAPQAKRMKVRRATNWTPQMDEHLWMTFMAYLSDPTLTPFKLLPGSSPPMGVCDQVATKAKRTWRPRKVFPLTSGSIDALVESATTPQREGSPDTIRPSSLQVTQTKWPKVAATRKRLRQLCQVRPSISAHYQRMLRTRSPSPLETSSPPIRPAVDQPSTFSSHDMIHSLVTSTAPSMQPDGPLAQLAREAPADIPSRDQRPDDWYACIGRSQAHKKSQSLQSELNIISQPSSSVGQATEPLASPFNFDAPPNRSQLLQSMAATKSLGRTQMNGRSLASPLEFKPGAPTERRSRKRRFRSDEEKPRRGALEDVFGPPDQTPMTRHRGFTVGAAQATDNLARLFTPTSNSTIVDSEMSEVADATYAGTGTPAGSRSAPRRLAEPIPRLGSPFTETPFQDRQRNTFPRGGLNQALHPFKSFHDRLLDAANQAPPPFYRTSDNV